MTNLGTGVFYGNLQDHGHSNLLVNIYQAQTMCRDHSRCWQGLQFLLLPSRVSFTKLHLILSYKVKMKMLVAQSCSTLCDSVDCSPPGSSVHGIFQARVLEWVAISFSRGSSWPRDGTRVFCRAGKFFTLNHQRSPEILFMLQGPCGCFETCRQMFDDSFFREVGVCVPSL